ncbi:inositol hexakisphosphate kinase [Trichomonas vaginalis G3]|uniref:Kinase n=2 Tax=Trichomonas vaginalis TaxID=5722 RepID=A0A8U0WPB9_TRIV3|nr:inositol hexakisphosphate kinase [Trichomonas vaginalis G3]AAR37418.1 inositol hexakisphosphate kinase [Trichomonas vaginalis]EAY11027.1 inositol hexakisphosphate kinase [Trichomonas vaginalis G3]KAI5531799.1 inositol hexakisphosphate kinase [Trichomonas vaginalis G3]|eukprot:XP_001323250.1 inositol hexakisphosphate kinase [Trichomonas vaginalis G3]
MESNSDSFSSSDLDPLNTQGGGHGQLCKIKNLDHGIDCVAKPLFEHENNFYTIMTKTPLADCLPRFFGNTQIDGHEYLLIEDLTAGMTSPCIADLKLGTRSFEIGVSESKVRKQMQNMSKSTTPKYAVRIIDVSMRKDGNLVNHWDRNFGKKAPIQSFIDTMNKFIPVNRKQEFLDKVEDVITKLTQTKEIYPGSRLYSASLLVVYDGDQDLPIRVALIDFAHAYSDITQCSGKMDSEEFEDNTILGLRNIIHLLTDPTELEKRQI